MTVQTTAKCSLCGTEGLPWEMGFICTSTFGMSDMALCATWFCQTPCYDKAHNSERIKGRVYQKHDAIQRGYQANLQDALIHTIATRPDQDHLPEELRVTETDVERLARCDGDYSVENLQDEDTIKACFKLLRNHRKLPYYHCRDGVGEIWDYGELCTRLDNLARRKA